MNPSIAKRIFILGCPRSGSTLLQSHLAAHPQIASFPESHLFSEHQKHWISRQLVRLGLTPTILSHRFNQFVQSIPAKNDQIKFKSPDSLLYTSYINQALALLDTVTISRGNTIWVEKTPRHLNEVGKIEKFVPEAYFIHIVRKPEHNIASLYELVSDQASLWYKPDALNICIDQWIEAKQFSDQCIDKAQHIVIEYENLISTTNSVLECICDFIQINFSAKMISDRKNVLDSIVLPSETWKKRVVQEVENFGDEKYYSLLTGAQRALVKQKLILAGYSAT